MTSTPALVRTSRPIAPESHRERTRCLHPDIVEAARFIRGIDTNQSIAQISDALYGWYVNSTELDPVDSGQTDGSANSSNPVHITPAAAFRHAHAGSQRFEPGWTVTAHHGWGTVAAVAASGVERLFRVGEFRRRTGNQLPSIGESILGEVAWTWVEEETGFWLTRRGAWEPIGATELVRVYFNATPEQACVLIRELTGVLLRDGASFMLKTPAARQHTGRADAVVLYLGDTDWVRMKTTITNRTRDIITRTATPRFAARVAPGIAWSVGPLTGESFGKLRCDLISDAVQGQSFSSEAGCVAAMAAVIEAAGLSTAQPHLGSGR